MRSKLGSEWKYHNEFEDFSQRYKGWFCALPAWEKSGIYLGIEQDSPFAMNMCFGLSKNPQDTNRESHANVYNKINENLMQGKKNPDWIWYNYLNPAYRYLGTDEMLVSLLEQPDYYAGQIANGLLAIKDIAAEDVNGLVED